MLEGILYGAGIAALVYVAFVLLRLLAGTLMSLFDKPRTVPRDWEEHDARERAEVEAFMTQYEGKNR